MAPRKTSVAEIYTHIFEDLDFCNSGILVQLFRNIVKIVGLAGVMLVLDVRLAAISFVLMPLVIGADIVILLGRKAVCRTEIQLVPAIRTVEQARE